MDGVPVEVEYKFKIPPDIQERLASINATLAKDITFTDVYLDTTDFVLCCSDTWLRKRNGKYQLKYAAPDRVKCDVRQYKETGDEMLIRQHVYRVIAGFNNTEHSTEHSYDLEQLVPYAELTTHRLEYEADQVVIDLDKTDFGYNVGEIEVVSSCSDDLQSAVEKVQRVAALLDVQTVDRPISKLMTYLCVHNKALRDKIYSLFKF